MAYKLGKFEENQVDAYADDLFTVPASLAGLPAISIPCGSSPEGLPIGEYPHYYNESTPTTAASNNQTLQCFILHLGLQIIGKRLAEDTILQVARALELTHQ